jgi:predicted phosphoribosyltransferase
MNNTDSESVGHLYTGFKQVSDYENHGTLELKYIKVGMTFVKSKAV